MLELLDSSVTRKFHMHLPTYKQISLASTCTYLNCVATNTLRMAQIAINICSHVKILNKCTSISIYYYDRSSTLCQQTTHYSQTRNHVSSNAFMIWKTNCWKNSFYKLLDSLCLQFNFFCSHFWMWNTYNQLLHFHSFICFCLSEEGSRYGGGLA